MKAMSLRIRMQTLSPCPTPSRCKPPAMRPARSATSPWLRRHWPLMMPWKRGCFDIVSFRSRVGFKDSGCHSGARRRREPGISRFSDVQLHIVVRVFDAPRNDGDGLPHIRKTRRALFDVGAHGLELIGATHQFHLLDGFGEQMK